MEDYSEINNDSEYIIIPNPIYDDRNDYLKILIKRDNTISDLEMKVEQKEKLISEKEKVISEKEKELETKDKELENKNKVIIEFAKTLKDLGLPLEVIKEKTGLSKEQIINL